MKIYFSRKIFQKKKISNIKFCQNPSSGRTAVPWRRTDTKLVIAFRNFTNAPRDYWQNVMHALREIIAFPAQIVRKLAIIEEYCT